MTIDGRGRHHQPAGVPKSAGGQFSTTPSPAAAATLAGITSWEPAAIDEALSQQLQKVAIARHRLQGAQATLDRMLASRTTSEAATATQRHRVDALTADVAELGDEVDAHQAEFTRRGGWTRAWLVTSSDGHVHSTPSCHTCTDTTAYALLPHYSGADQTEIVADAGTKACTVCYPSAPVDVLAQPQRWWATRHAQPPSEYIQLRSEHTARQYAVDAIVVAYQDHVYDRLHPDAARARFDQQVETVGAVVGALAAKHGRTADEVLDELEQKAAAKYCRVRGRQIPNGHRLGGTFRDMILRTDDRA